MCTENVKILARLELVEFFFQQQRVRAEVNVFLARDQAFDDLRNLRMHQRLAARDAAPSARHIHPPRGNILRG